MYILVAASPQPAEISTPLHFHYEIVIGVSVRHFVVYCLELTQTILWRNDSVFGWDTMVITKKSRNTYNTEK